MDEPPEPLETRSPDEDRRATLRAVQLVDGCSYQGDSCGALKTEMALIEMFLQRHPQSDEHQIRPELSNLASDGGGAIVCPILPVPPTDFALHRTLQERDGASVRLLVCPDHGEPRNIP
jgi:hypothetical protein